MFLSRRICKKLKCIFLLFKICLFSFYFSENISCGFFNGFFCGFCFVGFSFGQTKMFWNEMLSISSFHSFYCTGFYDYGHILNHICQNILIIFMWTSLLQYKKFKPAVFFSIECIVVCNVVTFFYLLFSDFRF